MKDKTIARPEPDLKLLMSIARREARKFLTGSSLQVSRDLVQSAVVEYLVAAQKQDIEAPQAFMRIIARRRGIGFRDEWERRRGDLIFDDPVNGAEDGGRGGFELPSLMASPEAVEATRARRKRVAAAIARLEATDQQIVELTYLEDPPLTAPQVGERLGLKPGTVRNRLVAIRRSLMVLLAEEKG